MLLRRWLVGTFLVLALSALFFWTTRETPDQVRPRSVRYQYEEDGRSLSESERLELSGGLVVTISGKRLIVSRQETVVGSMSLEEELEKLAPDESGEGSLVALGAERGYVVSIDAQGEPAVELSFPRVPSDEDRIVIDKSGNFLYWYTRGVFKSRYAVATGKQTKYTPEGVFSVAVKIEHPDGPDQAKPQLGERWLGLAVPNEYDKRGPADDLRAPKGQKYGIHGTDEPSSIGNHASGGCIRMRNEDVLVLYDQVPVGTTVEIRP